jgi:hypothetical protein
MVYDVIPAEAGIQDSQGDVDILDSGACPGPDPGFTGVTYKKQFFHSFPFGKGGRKGNR